MEDEAKSERREEIRDYSEESEIHGIPWFVIGIIGGMIATFVFLLVLEQLGVQLNDPLS